jgi:hypothetical protein
VKFIWDKLVVMFYRERQENPETKALVVVKAKRLEVSKYAEDTKIKGNIEDFFPLSGNIDYISSDKGLSDRYVMCWRDEDEEDMNKAWRGKVNGVTFPNGIRLMTDKKGKRIYNANFRAE